MVFNVRSGKYRELCAFVPKVIYFYSQKAFKIPDVDKQEVGVFNFNLKTYESANPRAL